MTSGVGQPSFVDLAIQTAMKSPCAKSKRGVVVFHPVSGAMIGTGFNGMPRGFSCSGTDECREMCSKRCVHAEERAIRQALFRLLGSRITNQDQPLDGFEAVHVKVVDGKLVPGGAPSCWQCSRTVLDVGLKAFWLYEIRWSRTEVNANWVSYTAEEFHRITLHANKLIPLRCASCGATPNCICSNGGPYP